MIETPTLPSVETIPTDIDERLKYFIHQAPDQVTEQWLRDLIKNSGHLTTPEYMRWRVVSLVWLATRFNVEAAWPYLMWLNMNEPTLGDHLNEVLTDGVEEMQCHVQLANWIAQAEDERLTTFFSTYKNIPAPHKMGSLVSHLVAGGDSPGVGVWLTGVCRDIADNPSPYMRPWRLLLSAWYAACFNPQQGAAYLRQLSDGAARLSAEDNQLISAVAAQLNVTSALIRWIAACPDPVVKTMLQDFGHPDLTTFVDEIFANSPDYSRLTTLTGRAAVDARVFRQLQTLLTEAAFTPKTGKLLDLACGPLAPQTLLFSSAGYEITGADLHIPPAYLPTSFMQRFKKGKHVKAWQAATNTYYQALAQQIADINLTWKKATVELADIRRLPFDEASFGSVICANYLQHAPDVRGLLAEAARVLAPNGLLLAMIKPYVVLDGHFQPGGPTPWHHLRASMTTPSPPLFNQWRETQYRAALEDHFIIEQWLTVQDTTAETRLTTQIQAELAEYNPAELTCQEIVVVALKKS